MINSIANAFIILAEFIRLVAQRPVMFNHPFLLVETVWIITSALRNVVWVGRCKPSVGRTMFQESGANRPFD